MKAEADLAPALIQQYGPTAYVGLMMVTCLMGMVGYLRVRVAISKFSLMLDPTDRPFKPFKLTDSLLGYLTVAFPVHCFAPPDAGVALPDPRARRPDPADHRWLRVGRLLRRRTDHAGDRRSRLHPTPDHASRLTRPERFLMNPNPSAGDPAADPSPMERSGTFTPGVIEDIQIKAELARYRIRGFGILRPRTWATFDDLTFIPCTLTRIPLWKAIARLVRRRPCSGPGSPPGRWSWTFPSWSPG